MDESQVIRIYGSLDRNAQILLLARLAHEMTVCARETYVVGTEDIADPQRLRMFNELLHRITGQLIPLVHDDSERYPDDVFAAMIWQTSLDLGVDKTFIRCLQRTQSTPLKQTA
jgi:hypothetical protein